MSSEMRNNQGSCGKKIILGERLQELRKEQGWSQRQCAEMLGLNSVTYLHYEKEQRQPPLQFLADAAALYGVTVDYLLGMTDL